MLRALIILVLAAAGLSAAVNLYLKDGSYQRVREYEVKGDRVRFYSVERSDWEEIPLELIDLRKTQTEEAATNAVRKEEVMLSDAEDKAERDFRRELARVPQNPGPYWIQDEKNLVALKQAESKVVNDKKRSILKVLTPIPIVPGKSTLELDGEHSTFIVTSARPEFYFRLTNEEQLAIVKLGPKKGSRLVETWNKLPVTNELIQEHKSVDIFRRMVDDDLYKIWPKEDVESGEYAVIQFTEGEGNTQVWDFAIKAAR
jgi:hypothetical protein